MNITTATDAELLRRIDAALERAGHRLDQASSGCQGMLMTADTRQDKLKALVVENAIDDAGHALEEIRALIASHLQQ